MLEKYFVYMHINKINQKKYIGITCQKPERRWGLNGGRYKANAYFYNAILKYGWDNFEHIVLMEGLSKIQAENEEIKLIKLYETVNKEKGYNISNGGSLAGKHSKATRKIMSVKAKCRKVDYNKIRKMQEANRNRNYTKEHRQNISNSLKGKKLSPEHIERIKWSHIGYKHTTEQKEKISISLKKTLECPEKRKLISDRVKKTHSTTEYKNKVRMSRTKTNKPVILTNTLECFKNHLEAGETKGLQCNKVLKNCEGELLSVGKDSNGLPLIWVFEEDFKENYDYQREYNNKRSQLKSKASKTRWNKYAESKALN